MLQPSDRKYDQHQTPKLPAKNQPFGAQTFQTLKDMILNLVQEGKGIRVERRGFRVFVHATGVGGKGTGSSGGRIWYTASTKAGLPEGDGIAETALGRVTAGADVGMVCIRNPDNDGWDAITHLE